MTPSSAYDTLCEQDVTHGKVVSLPTVYHVGNLDGDRDIPHTSCEGRELSVSTHPGVWERIIRRDGTATHETLHTYELSNTQAEFYYVDPTSGLETEQVWCLNNGYTSEVTGYRVDFTDENNDERYLKFRDKETARTEAESRQTSYKEEPVLTLGPRGIDYWDTAFRQPPENASSVLIEGLLPIWYASHLGVDGVWWDEQLAPEKRSTPRGCIFQEQLSRWDTEITETTDPTFKSKSRRSP